MVGGEGTEYNGRVTLAVLGQKVDALVEETRATRRDLAEFAKCIGVIQIAQGVQEERLDNHRRDIDGLRAASNRNDILVGISAAVASAVAAVLGTRN